MELLHPHHFFNLECSNLLSFFDEKKPTWEFLKKLEELIASYNLGSFQSKIPSTVELINSSQIVIGKKCHIGPFSVIEGPCVIQDYVEIGPQAYIRKGSYIDHHAKIGHSSEIKGSILLPYSKAPHFNYVGDSILGSFVNLGAGVVLANYRLNKTPVNIKYNQTSISTELTKFGAVIGDHSFLGCNSVTSPGTFLKKGFQCLPCSNVYGLHL
jgi:bifunctional N-acetylglucosamine-1-phosphate-uridyltransferase/glucosamine-1-phosphate-acetyltransferase GlmU-like protein